jgi:cytochrome oxidase assembly protein ShyY1
LPSYVLPIIFISFILENNEIIYINRGWVPKKYADKKTRKFSLLEENVKVVGLVRLPVTPGLALKKNVY